MRFLVDECTGPAVADWLRLQGHNVFSIYDEARGLGNDAVLQRANDEDRILITNDKDFGEYVFRERRPHKGVIVLRLDDERARSKIDALRRLLEAYSHDLPGRFVVVREARVRFARR